MGYVLNHKHDWSATNSGYGCVSCSAMITHAEVLANPAPTGVSAADHVGRKLNK